MTPSSIFDLSGKRIWIFGGAGYLGQPTIRVLDELNAEVVCIDLPGKAGTFLAGAGLSSRIAGESLDLGRTDELLKWVRGARGGAPDGAVFLTTPMSGTRMTDLTAEELNRYNEVGLTALFCAVREIGLEMVKRGSGSLVLCSSMYGQVAPNPSAYPEPMPPNPLHYGMQKAAINQMMRYLAVMWGPHNVRCNAVAPGPFPHPEMQRTNPEFMERLGAKVPMGRIGKQHEVAGALAFLLSDAASYVNGHNLVVDGGWTAW